MNPDQFQNPSEAQDAAEEEFHRGLLTDRLLLIITAVYFAGMRSVLGPCGPKEDGSFMTCHWAGNAVMGVSALLLVLAVIHFTVRDKQVKLGLSAAMIPTAVLAAVIPNRLIHLCMMHTMRCHAVMTPAVYILSALTAAAAVFDILRQRKAA